MKSLTTGLLSILLVIPALAVDDPKAANADASVSFVLGQAQGQGVPTRDGSARTGGGNINVSQPAPDTLWITMAGAAASKAHPLKVSTATLTFDLCQDFEVVVHRPEVKKTRLIMWGRTIGLLRSSCGCQEKGSMAAISTPGHASVNCGPTELAALTMPSRAVDCGRSLSIIDREGPVWTAVVPGKYSLHQSFGISASHAKGFLCNKPVSAEFAPGETLVSDWLGKREPFHGATKDDFGFQVIIKVVAEEEPVKTAPANPPPFPKEK